MRLLPPPGPQRNQQLGVLAVVLVIAGVMGWRYLPAAAPAAASNPQARTEKTPEVVKAMPQPVRFEKLEPVPEAPATSRNPFRFGVPPAPPPKPQPVYVPPPAPPPGPPPAPPVPPIPLRFVGRLVRPDGRIVAALSDGKGGVWEAVEGQIVDGRYRVVKIGEESVIIEYVNGTGRTTVGLR